VERRAGASLDVMLALLLAAERGASTPAAD
jgi:hypothetical protein